MSRIFLSHSSADEFEAIALKHWLASNGWDDVFLDVDPQRGLTAGERWQEALRQAADRCEAVVFVISPSWAKSKWCLAEFLLARNLNKLIFGVVLKDVPIGELPTEMTAEWQLCHLIGLGPAETIHFTYRQQPADITFLADGLKRLQSGLRDAGLSANFFPWPPKGDESRSPYRGLEPLDAQDAAVFFGRDAEVLQGLDRIRGMRAAGDEGLCVILGASGAGKSSFLRAGLLPRLARDDRHFLPLPPLRPERSPLFGERGLAHALCTAHANLQLAPINPGDVKAALREGAGRFAALLRNIRNGAHARLVASPDDASPPTLVLPVDQAEELFSADATEETHAFLELIGSVLRDAVGRARKERCIPLIVVFTIRSDRYEPLQIAPELAGLKTVVFDGLRPMPPAQFKEVITGPASRTLVRGRRVEFRPDLVSRLLADCAQGADTLPLLSLTLARLYTNYGADGDLRADEYQRMGGIGEVIQTEAESILASDPAIRSAQLESLHAAFIPWLATINADDDQPMRRIARLSDLPTASRPLVQALIEKRLLVSDSRSGETVVEVAHESLLRQWNTLADWLRTEREDLKEADRLEQTAGAWTKSGCKADWLIEGERLAVAEALAAKPSYRKRLEPVADFLLASRQREAQRRAEEERARQTELGAAREKQAAAEVLAAEQHRAAVQARADAARLRTRGKQLMGLVAAAVVVALIAIWFSRLANQQSRLAERQSMQSNALRLNAEAQAILSGNRPGGLIAGLLRLAAAYRLAPHGEIEGEILTRVVALQGLERIIETDFSPLGVSFTPDGTRVAAFGGDFFRLWDVNSGQPVGPPVQAHQEGVTSIAFSPDGAFIVSGGNDRTVQAWDAGTGEAVGDPATGLDAWVRCVAFSPDGAEIVTGIGSTLQFWDAEDGEPIGEAIEAHEGYVASVAFSPDGARIVSSGQDAKLRLWDVESHEPIGVPLTGHEGSVQSVAFSPDGSRIVSGGFDVRLWNAESGRPIGQPMTGHVGMVTSVVFSPDGARIVSGGDDMTVRLWDAKTGQPVGEPMKGHEGGITSVAFSPDGAHIVSAGDDMTLRFWSARSGPSISETLQGHADTVASVAFSPDDARIVSASHDGSLQLWDAATGKPVGAPMEGHSSFVSSAAFSPDGTRIVSGSYDGTLRLWDAASGRPIGAPLKAHDAWVMSVAFNSDGTRIVSASYDGTVQLWDATRGQPIGMALGTPMEGNDHWISSVTFSPDGTQIVSSGADGTLLLWDARSGKPIGEPLRGHETVVSSVDFSPDGARIVSGSYDQTVRLWDANSLHPIGGPMRGHTSLVESVAFSPDGAQIVSGGDKTLRFWDGKTGQPIGPPLEGHTSAVRSVAFSHDGARIASGGNDATLRLWPGPKVWVDLLCTKLTRNMSREEWREWVSPDFEYQASCPGLPVPADDPASKE